MWILPIVFGSLYFIGTFCGNINDDVIKVIEASTDLWANLFASMIVVVLIERIITRVRVEKNQHSISLIRLRVANALTNLITSVKVPAEWRKNIDDQKFNWGEYHSRLRYSRDTALNELESTVANYSYLLNHKLTNDIIGLRSALGEYYDYHVNASQRGYYNLVDAGMFSGLFISESIKILQKHKLLEQNVPDIIFETGEPPKIFWREHWMSAQEAFNYYGDLLKETTSFRDECRERYMRKGRTAN